MQSIRLWLLGLVLIPIAFLVVVLGAVLRLDADARNALSWAQHSDDVLSEVRRLQADAADGSTAVRRFLLTGAPSSYADYDTASARIPKDAQRLRALVSDNPSQLALATDFANYTLSQIKDTNALMERMRHGNRQAIYQQTIAQALRNPHYGQSGDRIPGELAQFQRTEQDLAAERRLRTKRLWTQSSDTIIGAMIVAVLLSIIVGFTLARRIVRRLRILREQAIAFASSGTLPVPISGIDEIADVSRTLREMAVAVTERSDALERYRLLADLAHDAILFVRRSDAWIVEANDAAVRIYGYSHDELRRLRIHDLAAPDASKPAGVQVPKEGAFSLHFETEHRRKDGSAIPVELSMQSAYLKGEQMLITIIRDITERREAEATTRTALYQATEASRQKSEFVATMSHEIRTPMNGVIGMTELLLESKLDRDQRELATTARDSAHALLGIINNILDFSKMEAGKIEMEISEFDLVAKVEGVASMLGSEAHKKGISLMSYVDPLIPPRLLGDSLRLRQVLVNLVGNAVKFTEAGGVAIIVNPIMLAPETIRLRFAVNDSGIGIASDALPRIFDSFQQADGSTTRRFGGTGLGLAISKRLVEVMGGELQVESEVGRGSTFWFELDLRVGDRTVLPRRDLRDLNAIIVDDDVISRDILSRYANSWGLRTSVAQSAEAAFAMMLDAARRGKPYGIAIIDLRLPHTDGIELARRVREEVLTRDVKLLLVTAFDAPQKGQEAINAGFSAYLTKPVRQSQLYDAIVETLVGPRVAEQTQAQAESAPAHGERILLVEDNEVNRKVFLRQLERLGYRGEVAADGQEAVTRLAREKFDLVFMDCHMPVMDGFQATREIRKMESRTGSHVPIVAMTANALSGDREACLSAGMDDYLSKPAALADVSRVLNLYLDRPTAVDNVTPQ